jgi:predicted nucleotidyltransferase
MELELAPDFKELLRLLNEKQVKYLLIGGYAVVLHGYVRNTNDIDIVVADDLENAEKVVAALAEFGFAGDSLSTKLFTQPNSVVRMGTEPMKIEILKHVKGVGFEAPYERRRTIKAEDIESSVIGLDDLILNKQSVGRLQDLTDVEKLQKTNK